MSGKRKTAPVAPVEAPAQTNGTVDTEQPASKKQKQTAATDPTSDQAETAQPQQTPVDLAVQKSELVIEKALTDENKPKDQQRFDVVLSDARIENWTFDFNEPKQGAKGVQRTVKIAAPSETDPSKFYFIVFDSPELLLIKDQTFGLGSEYKNGPPSDQATFKAILRVALNPEAEARAQSLRNKYLGAKEAWEKGGEKGKAPVEPRDTIKEGYAFVDRIRAAADRAKKACFEDTKFQQPWKINKLKDILKDMKEKEEAAAKSEGRPPKPITDKHPAVKERLFEMFSEAFSVPYKIKDGVPHIFAQKRVWVKPTAKEGEETVHTPAEKPIAQKPNIQAIMNRFCAEGYEYRPIKFFYLNNKGQLVPKQHVVPGCADTEVWKPGDMLVLQGSPYVYSQEKAFGMRLDCRSLTGVVKAKERMVFNMRVLDTDFEGMWGEDDEPSTSVAAQQKQPENQTATGPALEANANPFTAAMPPDLQLPPGKVVGTTLRGVVMQQPPKTANGNGVARPALVAAPTPIPVSLDPIGDPDGKMGAMDFDF